MNDFASICNCQVTLTPIHRSDCGLQAFDTTVCELTAQKMLAESLLQQVFQLQDCVADKTQQLETVVMELKRKNKEIANSSSVISNHRREKEMILHEVYHRVKNNLQVVESMLKMKRRSLTDETAREAFETSIVRIHGMAMVHEHLYQMPDLGGISLTAYLGDLIEEAIAAHSQKPAQVEFELDVEEIPLVLDAALPFGLLMNELLSNCLEHGLPEDSAGKIYLSLRRTANGVRLAIQDNGAGLPEGFDLSASSSMGLKLAAGWAHQLGGTLAVTSGQGCRVQADFTRLTEQVKTERPGIALMMATAAQLSAPPSSLQQN